MKCYVVCTLVPILVIVALFFSACDGSGGTLPVDADGDTLIDIHNLDMLNNVRHALNGTSYRTSATDTGMRCGVNGTVDCTGYELMRNLDFADRNSYANGTVNIAWRPTLDGAPVEPAMANNFGWTPIAYQIGIPKNARSRAFVSIFEGNGYSISNLYIRNTNNENIAHLGIFGFIDGSTDSSGIGIRNLSIINGNIYGGTRTDVIGMLVGAVTRATRIINCSVQGGSINDSGNSETASNSASTIGGLIGGTSGGGGVTARNVIASSYVHNITMNIASGTAQDAVGGLVGALDTTQVFASYASGTISTSGVGTLGGLAGSINSVTIITASYSNATITGTNIVGGLVARTIRGTISQSYANGAVNTGSAGGALIGEDNMSAINASYGFGAVTGAMTMGSAGSTRENGTTAANLTADNAGSCSAGSTTTRAACTATTGQTWSSWSEAANGAWDFGNGMQPPALRYADYDGTGTTNDIDYCALFRPSTGTITCGTTLIANQPGR